MKKFVSEFKEFISRGNVMDLAVGVIIGGAFKTIIDSLVKDILMPLIGGITGGVNLVDLTFSVRGIKVGYGLFVNAIINFLIIALVIFVMIKLLAKMKRKKDVVEEVVVEAVAEEVLLLREIRDTLKNSEK
ncbi:MAG: large conductance mechanosensitive channel [Fusobacteria bacterium]|nr:MAG: large conductance mechanosensitive channel [Fusobacteriota bacterium]KAF0228475.1 MAG: large conductance mechanosensitive [Fusobacteriota bacterium]